MRKREKMMKEDLKERFLMDGMTVYLVSITSGYDFKIV